MAEHGFSESTGFTGLYLLQARKNHAKGPINPCGNKEVLVKLLGSIDPSEWVRLARHSG
jgi:hypothetical protein